MLERVLMKVLKPDCIPADAAKDTPPTSATEPAGARFETVFNTVLIEKEGSMSGNAVARVPAKEP